MRDELHRSRSWNALLIYETSIFSVHIVDNTATTMNLGVNASILQYLRILTVAKFFEWETLVE
jgi:hypothetical protein